MWGDIILSLTISVSEAMCVSFLNRKKLEKFNTKLPTLVEKLFDEFADTSLDSNQFARIISSRAFKEMLRNYFFSIRDGLSHSEYINRFEAYICKEDDRLIPIEVRRFINKIYELYTDFLHKVIEENYELNAVVQILTISHRELLSKILESEENLHKYIKSIDKSTFTISDKDILTYHNNCIKEFSKVRFTGISGAEHKVSQDLNVFYVENTFSYYNKEILGVYNIGSDEIKELQLADFFDYGNKIVLVGAAGLGKSTTLNYLFCNYEKLYNANALKLKIDLKEYAKNIVEDKKDILWCLATEFRKRIKRTKLQFEDIEQIIAEFLDRGDCLVILDALDEIPTQAMRNSVRTEISNFCELYYLNRFIISTREVGYLRNKFDASFLHIKINEFNNNQIKEYSKNWFKINYKQGSFKSFWQKFDVEVRKSKCGNLIRNPIVLILALVIFDIEKNLPNRRVKFYKKCIDTFLIVREDRKAAFEMDEKIKNILSDNLVIPKIAYYKFDHINQDASYKFTGEEVKNAIMDAIEVVDRLNWREAVNRYTLYLVNRTELLGEIDEDIYDFAHKTFYEYFLALYYSKVLENEELAELLNTWIGDANNDELARLIIEVVIEKNDPRQHKYIIDFMFEQIEKECMKTRDEYSKATDIFLIIADLYRNNMLLPKFHEKYYNCIIYNARMIEMAERSRRFTDSSTSRVIYDVDVLAQQFMEEISKKESFNYVIESLYSLNHDFKNKVVQDGMVAQHSHILNLFTWVKTTVRQNKQNSYKEDCEQEIKYFLEDQIDLTLSCPQIYISMVDFIIKKNKHELILSLLEYSAEAQDVFYSYTSPEILFSLINLAYQSAEGFLLFLISIIKCAKNCTNDLLWYILSSYKRDYGMESKMVEEKHCNQAIHFWELMNYSENVVIFESKIKELNLYNQKYKQQYEILFEEYNQREKCIMRESLIQEIEEFRYHSSNKKEK